jgi:hypothetical protein
MKHNPVCMCDHCTARHRHEVERTLKYFFAAMGTVLLFALLFA